MTARISICLRAGVLGGLLSLGLAGNAWADGARPLVVAQGLFPPAAVPEGDEPEGAGASDPSNYAIRIARLEDELRKAYGMIEELQNDNQRLEAELKRFREDVEFRLGGDEGAGGRGAERRADRCRGSADARGDEAPQGRRL